MGNRMAATRTGSGAATDGFLANLFDRIDINKTTPDTYASSYGLHVLSIEYPACNLLPPDTLPNLAPPQDVSRREPPPAEKAIGVYETTFYAILREKPMSMPPVLPASNHLALLGAVERLGSGEGTSKLELVCLYDGDTCDTIYHFKLTTHCAKGTDVSRYELTPAQWQFMLGFAETYEWLRTLQDLVTRKSYRAVFHVRERLIKHFGEKLAASEEAAWSAAWGTSIGKPPANNVEAAADRAMNSAKVYASINQGWTALDGEVAQGGKKNTIHCMTLFRTLHAALQSLNPPEAIVPASLCLARSYHVKLILESFESQFYGAEYYSSLTCEQLLTDLHQQANETRVSSRSPLALSGVATAPG